MIIAQPVESQPAALLLMDVESIYIFLNKIYDRRKLLKTFS